MNILKSGARLAGVVGAALFMAAAANAAPTTVKIVAFNDFHGNLQSAGTFNGVPAGGVDAMAAYVQQLKQQNPATIVVSAGDMIGASPLVSALFHDEGTIESMNRLGLDFNAVGNHEFDDGKAELLPMQNGGCHPTDANTCQGGEVGTPVPFEGAKFKFLAANVVETATGKTIFPPYGIKVVNGVRVGFIGLTLKETPTIVTPSGVAGLSFLDEVETINKLVPTLRARGVETIIVLIHQGGGGRNLNSCSSGSANSAIGNIVRRLDNAVDAVISGHSHSLYNCTMPNSVGRSIPVTQASTAGRVLTDMNLTIETTTGDVTAASVNNIVVDRSAPGFVPDATIASIVDGYSGLVAPLAARVIGAIAGPAGGDLIADSQLAATAAPEFGGAVVAFMNPGGVRNGGFRYSSYPSNVTYGDAFTVQPFGNSLVTMTLTGQQLKDLLEQQFRGCLGQGSQNILPVSASLTYSYQANNACGSRIVNANLNGTALISNGVVLLPQQAYRVTVNNFLATGGDGFGVLTGGTNLLGGAQDIDALVEYLAAYTPPNAPYDPASFPRRITRLP